MKEGNGKSLTLRSTDKARQSPSPVLEIKFLFWSMNKNKKARPKCLKNKDEKRFWRDR